MKEVFPLPALGETLIQPQPKQADKHSLLEEVKSFREVFEQAKSAPEKPLAKHRNGHSVKVHREEMKPLPESEELEAQVESQDAAPSASETDQIQLAANLLASPDTETIILIPLDPTLILNLGSEDTVQLQGESETAVLEGIGETTQRLPSDLSLIDSLSQEKNQAQVSQNAPVEKTFPQLIQAQDDPAPALQEVEQGDQTNLQSKASIKPEPHSSTEETQGKAVALPAADPKEADKAPGGQSSQIAGEKRPAGSSAHAQEAARENSRAGGSEAQPASNGEKRPAGSSAYAQETARENSHAGGSEAQPASIGEKRPAGNSAHAQEAARENSRAGGSEAQPASIGEKRPVGSSAFAQEAARENSRAGGSEAQPASIREGARPEAVQASGPPSSSHAAKPIEPARLAEAHRPIIIQQVARELEIFGKSGQTSLRIQLYPEQLGCIDVRLISKADGVQIVIHAENPSTAFLLERGSNLLRESLTQAGVNLSGLTVGQGQAQTRSDFSQSDFRTFHQTASRSGDSEGFRDATGRSSLERWRDSSSTIDYRI